MLKISTVLAIFLAFWFISACSDNSNSSISTDQRFTISKAPINNNPVSTFQMLSLEFSTAVDPSTITSSSVYIMDVLTQTKVDSEITVDSTNKKVTIKPYTYLSPSTLYSFVVTTNVQSAQGESLSIPYAYAFTTQNDANDPGGQISFVSSNPQTEVTADIDTDIKIGFDRFIAPSEEQLLKVSTGGVEVNGTVEYFNSVVTFTPSLQFTPLNVYDIDIIGSPTDMYGNSFNTSSKPSGLNFQAQSLIDSSGWMENNVIDIGHEGYLVRTFSADGESEYIAVAREGGVDFYSTGAGPITKLAYSLPISSKITDMRYTSSAGGNYNLLISTLSDGVYRVTFLNATLTDSNDFNVVQYLASETNIYGVDFGLDSDGYLDKIYAVGPSMGLKVLNLDENADLTTIDSIAVDGSPLKVVSYTGGAVAPVRHVFVSDYENGVLYFDENGSSQVNTNMTGSINHIFKINEGLNDFLYSIDAVGNYKYVNAGSIGDPIDASSALSYVNDVSPFQDLSTWSGTLTGTLTSMPEKGVAVYNADSNDPSNVYLLKPSTGHPVSAAVVYYGSSVVILTREGKLFVYGESIG